MRKRRTKRPVSVKLDSPVKVQLVDKKTFFSQLKPYLELAGVFVAMVGAIAAFFTVGLTRATVDEMKKQREGSYMPHFAIGDTRVELSGIPGFYYDDPMKNPEHGLGWTVHRGSLKTDDDGNIYTDSSEKEWMDDSLYPILSFRIENIGLGIAKDVKAEWSTENIPCFMKYYQSLDSPCKDFVIDQDGDAFVAVSYYNMQLLTKHFDLSKSTGFLRPFGSGDNYYIDIDASVYGLLTYWSFMGGYGSDRPSLILDLTYEDVYSVTHYTKMEITCSYESDYVTFRAKVINDN